MTLTSNARSTCGLAAGVVMILASLAAPASAQMQMRNDASVGYSYLSFREGGDSLNIPTGWNASFAAGLTEHVAMIGDLGGHYKKSSGETLRIHTFQAGVRVSGKRSASVVPFVQFLAGLAHGGVGDSGSFAKAMQVGGGIDLALGNSRAALRTQVDLPFYFDNGERLDAIRLTVGIVLPLK